MEGRNLSPSCFLSLSLGVSSRGFCLLAWPFGFLLAFLLFLSGAGGLIDEMRRDKEGGVRFLGWTKIYIKSNIRKLIRRTKPKLVIKTNYIGGG